MSLGIRKKFFLFLTAVCCSAGGICADKKFVTGGSSSGRSGRSDFVNNSGKSVFGRQFEKPSSLSEFVSQSSADVFFVPSFYSSAASSVSGAYSPVFLLFSAGFSWPDYTFISVRPSFIFFYMYFLIDGERAFPSRYDSRQLTALAFMLNVPVCATLFLENSRISVSAGGAVLARFGLMSSGLERTKELKAAADEINRAFWRSMEFLYLSAEFSWSFRCSERLYAGPVLYCYFPVSAFFSGARLPDKMIFSAGMKMSF